MMVDEYSEVRISKGLQSGLERFYILVAVLRDVLV